MSKVTGIIIDIVTVVIVSVAMFIFAPTSAGTFAASYIFLIIAIIIQIVPLFMCQIEQNVVYKVSYIICSALYLFIQFIISIVAVVFFPRNTTQTIGLSIVMVLIYSVLMIILFGISMQGREQEKKQKEKGYFIRTVISALEICKHNLTDLELQKMCSETMEEIKYSSIMSGEAMLEIENQIQMSAIRLEDFSREHKINECKEECRSLLQLIRERNSKMKLYRN